MEAFFCIHYRIPKKTKAVELLENLQQVFKEQKHSTQPSWFVFEDSLHGKTKTCLRLVKRMAEFEPYLLADNTLTNYQQSWDFSLYRHEKNKPKLPDIETFKTIFQGIPRSYPFNNARLIFDDVPWGKAKQNCTQEINRTLENSVCSCLAIDSDWWISGRQIKMKAYVVIEVDPQVKGRLKIPSESLSMLEALGKIRLQELRIMASDAERKEIDAQKESAEIILKQAEKEMEAWVNSDTLPFVIQRNELVIQPEDFSSIQEAMQQGSMLLNNPNDDSLTVISIRGKGIPKKKIINQQLKPLGYRHLSKRGFQGFMVFGKTTERNNSIRINFDFGSYSPQISVFVEISGALWSHKLPIRYWRGPQLLGINNEVEFTQALSNITEIVKRLEARQVFDLEALYALTPSWVSYE